MNLWTSRNISQTSLCIQKKFNPREHHKPKYRKPIKTGRKPEDDPDLKFVHNEAPTPEILKPNMITV